ncbi:MAG: D-amino-acid transaminase [Alphaproteobacteria bacterium]|nr:D-amino-acid transaminase [Alphaproteobacteria bacterium]
MVKLAWLNGVFLAADEARISPFDRGFLFADGVYEVTAVYDGRLIDLDLHLDRLERSLRELGFPTPPDRGEIAAVHRRLIVDNDIREGYIYLQVTRGAYGARDFAAPAIVRPTCFAFAEAKSLINTVAAREGLNIITTPDIRWARRDIKSTGLLAQALAKTQARNAGVDDAWMVGPDGFVTEGASANAWIVNQDGDIVTRELSSTILAGVTRARLSSALSDAGLRLQQRAFTLEEAVAAREAFSTSATALVAPVVRIDGLAIGSGRPGPVTRRLQGLYFSAIGADPARDAPWLFQES